MFTDGRLVQAALQVLEPLYRGENALEPERVSEKLHQNTFWMGRGGTLTHTISGIDIALWDILGKATGSRSAGCSAAATGERVQPYCSLLMEEPDADARRRRAAIRAQGFRAFKIGWGPFGRRDDAAGRGDREGGARGGGRRTAKLMVDAGASDAYWPQRTEMGDAHGARCCRTTTSAGSRSRCGPDALDDFVRAAPRAARCRSPAARC